MIKEALNFIKYMIVFLCFSPLIAILITWFTIPTSLIVMYFFDIDFKNSLAITTIISVLYTGVDLYKIESRKEEESGENKREGF